MLLCNACGIKAARLQRKAARVASAQRGPVRATNPSACQGQAKARKTAHGATPRSSVPAEAAACVPSTPLVQQQGPGAAGFGGSQSCGPPASRASPMQQALPAHVQQQMQQFQQQYQQQYERQAQQQGSAPGSAPGSDTVTASPPHARTAAPAAMAPVQVGSSQPVGCALQV